jgi:hypothetical protein
MVKTSLMADLHIANFAKEPNPPYIEIVPNGALRRLRLYFPDAYTRYPVMISKGESSLRQASTILPTANC